MLQQRAYLFVGVFVVRTATVARVQATPAAAKQRAQPFVQDVLAFHVALGQMRYGIEDKNLK